MKKIKKLSLNRETLRNLQLSIRDAAGGGIGSGQYGPTCPSAPPNCNPSVNGSACICTNRC